MESFSIGRTLSRAWQLVIGTLPSVGLFLLVVTIVSKGLSFGAMSALKVSLEQPSAGGLRANLTALGSGSYIAITLLSVVVVAFIYAGTLRGLLQAGQGRPASLADCVRFGLAKLLPVLGLVILWYLAIIVGMILLVIPAIILTVMWSASLPALISENLGVLQSFGRSRELTKGSRGKIFLMLLLCIIVVYGGMFALLGLITGSNIMGMGLTIANNPALYAAQIPLSWGVTLALNALLASIYLETLAIKGGGPAGHLDQVFA